MFCPDTFGTRHLDESGVHISATVAEPDSGDESDEAGDDSVFARPQLTLAAGSAAGTAASTAGSGSATGHKTDKQQLQTRVDLKRKYLVFLKRQQVMCDDASVSCRFDGLRFVILDVAAASS